MSSGGIVYRIFWENELIPFWNKAVTWKKCGTSQALWTLSGYIVSDVTWKRNFHYKMHFFFPSYSVHFPTSLQSALFLTMYRTCTRWMKIVVHCLPSSAGCRSSRCFAVSPSVRGANGKVMMKDETTEILHICPCTVKLHFFWEPVLKVKNQWLSQFCYCTEFEIMWGSTVAWWLALFPQSKKVH